MSDSQTTAVEEVPASTGADVNTATEPSTAAPKEEGSEQKSMLDVVKATLKPGPDKSPVSDNGQDPKTVQPVDPNSPEAKAKADAEFEKSLSKDGQKRFRDLANGNRELREQVTVLKTKAEEFDRLDGLIRESQASPEDLKSALEITRLMKTGNSREALVKLQPIVKALLAAEGYELPDDLKAEVDAGALTQERAQELARQRHQNAAMTQRNEEQAKEQKAREFRESTDRMARDVDGWAAEQKTSDPDWHLKLPRVTEKFELRLNALVREGKYPTSEKEVRGYLEEAKKAVEAELKQFMPKPKAVEHHTGGASPAAKPKPESFLDVVRQTASGNA